MMKRNAFPPSARLRKTPEFQRVFHARNAASDALLTLFALRREDVPETGKSRLGLSVSRKVGPAVVRNRWKRLIREAFRKNRETLSVSYDFVVVPRRGAALPSGEAIRHSFLKLVRKIEKRRIH